MKGTGGIYRPILEKTARDRGRTDRINLIHDLDLDLQSSASYGHDLYTHKQKLKRGR